MSYYANVLADSISPAGVRLTTLETRFPRFILPELNTHRLFSRNSASSRAIPPEKIIEAVEREPFVPETFGRRVKGMGVGEDLPSDDQERARLAWKWHLKCSIQAANMLIDLDCDKSRINRLLEPHMWHTCIITSTEWQNFFGLRAPDSGTWQRDFPAQPEMQIIAIKMRDALWESEPQQLQEGWWHLPGATASELAALCEARDNGNAWALEMLLSDLRLACSRRLARVSFDKHAETELLSVSITKAGELKVNGHFSPFEHIARPLSSDDISDTALQPKIMIDLAEVSDAVENLRPIDPAKCWSGNLCGWLQFRKLMPNEDNFMEVRNGRSRRAEAS